MIVCIDKGTKMKQNGCSLYALYFIFSKRTNRLYSQQFELFFNPLCNRNLCMGCPAGREGAKTLHQGKACEPILF